MPRENTWYTYDYCGTSTTVNHIRQPDPIAVRRTGSRRLTLYNMLVMVVNYNNWDSYKWGHQF